MSQPTYTVTLTASQICELDTLIQRKIIDIGDRLTATALPPRSIQYLEEERDLLRGILQTFNTITS